MGKSPAAITKLPNLVSNLISQSKPTSRLSIFVGPEEELMRSRMKSKKMATTMETNSSDVDGAAANDGGSSSGSSIRVPLTEVDPAYDRTTRSR
ncbi:hypothetical protein LINPERHAP1_LOCUS17846 [Linum perenne]